MAFMVGEATVDAVHAVLQESDLIATSGVLCTVDSSAASWARLTQLHGASFGPTIFPLLRVTGTPSGIVFARCIDAADVAVCCVFGCFVNRESLRPGRSDGVVCTVGQAVEHACTGPFASVLWFDCGCGWGGMWHVCI